MLTFLFFSWFSCFLGSGGLMNGASMFGLDNISPALQGAIESLWPFLNFWIGGTLKDPR